jgi:hypothetical protein
VHRLRTPRPAPAAAVLYAIVALAVFGHHVLGHFGSAVIAPNDVDSSQYQWFLAWWPHAILHGQNPFITHVVYAPDGYNLTWTTSFAGPALLLSPVTLLFGATVSFNVFGLLAASLSALSVYALCRRLTGAFWPSLLAGLTFELCGYMLTAMQGDPWLAFVALIPLAVLLVLRRLDGELGRRTFVVLLALTIALQFLTSAEVLATAALFGAIALLLGWVLNPGRRRDLAALLMLIAAAFGLAAVVLSPFLAFMLQSHPVPNQALSFARAPTDPAALWVPSQVQAHGDWQLARWRSLGLPPADNPFAFLGLPLLVIAVAVAGLRWRERASRLVIAMFAVVMISLLGMKLTIAGHQTGIPLPWALVHHLPLYRYALPVRLGVFSALLTCVIFAIWLARTRSRWRWAGAALVLLALLPSLSAPVWSSNTSDPRFFADGTYKRYLRARDNVLTIPAIGPNERWQERTGFAFRIVGGYLGAFPDTYTRYRAWTALLAGRPTADWPAVLRTYLVAKRVSAIVIDRRLGPRWPALFTSLGMRPQAVDGVLLYRLRN